MAGVSNIQWNHSKIAVLKFLRTAISKVDEHYITSVFGFGKNGVRERAWKRFLSGSLDMGTLRMASASMECDEDPVTIVEIKCTPSMKSEVYGVCLVFRSDGTYLPNKSKCDCPNGWLFCSHSLALFVLIMLIQIKPQWTFEDFCGFMPEPIKTLQNQPIAASMVFKQGCHRKATKAIGKSLAKEITGYSAANDDTIDKDEREETSAQQAALKEKGKGEVKSISMSKMLEDHLNGSADAIKIDRSKGDKGDGKKGRKGRKQKNKAKKVTSMDINQFNHDLVHANPEPAARCKYLLQQNRVHDMMKHGIIGSNCSLAHHLRFFEEKRVTELDQRSQSTNNAHALGNKLAVDCANDFLEKYFNE
ncbi:hypothetical protein ACHAWF_006819 [Thalassiosira exigua]